MSQSLQLEGFVRVLHIRDTGAQHVIATLPHSGNLINKDFDGETVGRMQALRPPLDAAESRYNEYRHDEKFVV